MVFNRALRAFDRVIVPTNFKFARSQPRRSLPFYRMSFHQSETLSGSRESEGTIDVDEDRADPDTQAKIGVLGFRPYVAYSSISKLNPSRAPPISDDTNN